MHSTTLNAYTLRKALNWDRSSRLLRTGSTSFLLAKRLLRPHPPRDRTLAPYRNLTETPMVRFRSGIPVSQGSAATTIPTKAGQAEWTRVRLAEHPTTRDSPLSATPPIPLKTILPVITTFTCTLRARTPIMKNLHRLENTVTLLWLARTRPSRTTWRRHRSPRRLAERTQTTSHNLRMSMRKDDGLLFDRECCLRNMAPAPILVWAKSPLCRTPLLLLSPLRQNFLLVSYQ
jgi:hypothetical protein